MGFRNAASLSLATVLGLSGVANAADVPRSRSIGEKHARPSLICETTSLIAGQTAWLGVHFDIDEGWHVYWNGQNDTGFPIGVELSLPKGFTAGPTHWPAPMRHVAPGDILDHIYEDSVTLAIPIFVPADAKGNAEFTAKLSWLVCREACVAEDAVVSITLPVKPAAEGASLTPTPSASAAEFKKARARWPQPMNAASRVSLQWTDDKVVLSAPGAAQMAFFPELDCTAIDNLVKSGAAKADRLELKLQPEDEGLPRLRGVLEVRRGTGSTVWFEVNQTPADATDPKAAQNPPTKPRK